MRVLCHRVQFLSSLEIVHVIQIFRFRCRQKARTITTAVCPWASRGWCNAWLRVMAQAELGVALTGAKRGAGGHAVRPEHRGNRGDGDRSNAPRDRHLLAR